jgi:hypothetical protein
MQGGFSYTRGGAYTCGIRNVWTLLCSECPLFWQVSSSLRHNIISFNSAYFIHKCANNDSLALAILFNYLLTLFSINWYILFAFMLTLFKAATKMELNLAHLTVVGFRH